MDALLKEFTKTINQLENKMKVALDNVPKSEQNEVIGLRQQIANTMKAVRSGDVTELNKIIRNSDEELKKYAHANTDNK